MVRPPRPRKAPRTFLVHLPASAPPPGERMLIISLHGNGGRGSQQRLHGPPAPL